jgi:hypothetical protein
MRSVLLAWELGAGFGHALALRQIAVRLMQRGFRCIAAVKDIGAAAPLSEAGIEVLQAPLWKAAQSSATLGDALGDAGLADAQSLRQLIEAWRHIIDKTAPDVVVADYAPGACLAARGRIPLALIGNGFTLPPADMQNFPLLHQISAPVWPEQTLLDAVNSVLVDLQLQPLQRLPQLFAGDVAWVYSFPLLDPYASSRTPPAQGPQIGHLPEPRAAGAAEILVYLSAAGLSHEEQAHLSAMGMRLESKPFDMRRDLAAARLMIHLGSGGTANSCLLAGVPQLVCAVDVEKELIGKALVTAGIGTFLPVYDPAVALTENAVGTLLMDGAMAEQAAAVGAAHRDRYRNADPLSEFETACVELLSC